MTISSLASARYPSRSASVGSRTAVACMRHKNVDVSSSPAGARRPRSDVGMLKIRHVEPGVDPVARPARRRRRRRRRSYRSRKSSPRTSRSSDSTAAASSAESTRTSVPSDDAVISSESRPTSLQCRWSTSSLCRIVSGPPWMLHRSAYSATSRSVRFSPLAADHDRRTAGPHRPGHVLGALDPVVVAAERRAPPRGTSRGGSGAPRRAGPCARATGGKSKPSPSCSSSYHAAPMPQDRPRPARSRRASSPSSRAAPGCGTSRR